MVNSNLRSGLTANADFSRPLVLCRGNPRNKIIEKNEREETWKDESKIRNIKISNESSG